MSVYLVKLLELLSIEQQLNQSFLRVKFLSDEDVELLWEIDQYTADHLKALTVFHEHHKYRLSFFSSWDSTKNQYVSYFTRTYRDQSEKVYFSCSKAYVNGLQAIRHNEQTNQIRILKPLNEDVLPINSTETELVHPKKTNHKFAWISTVLVSILTVIIVSTSLLSEAEENENTNVIVESISKEVISNAVVTEPLIVSADAQTNSSSEASTPLNESVFPVAELNEVVTYSIQKGSVALTFDDGPSKFTKEIIDILKNYNIGGTFFFIGSNVMKNLDAVQYVNDNGYSIGNHSMSHSNFINLTADQQAYELLHTNQLIEEIIDEEITLFRPPYGSKNETSIELMNKTNSKMVLWNSDTEDWKSQDVNEIFQYVVNSKASGSIILLHESQAVIEALPRIIEYLQEQDLEIVSLN